MASKKIGMDDWFDLIVKSLDSSDVMYGGQALPGFPSDQIQANTTGQSGANTLKEAFIYYKDCVSEFERLGAHVNKNSTLLDFGAGWGRISRFFLRDIAPANLYGVDVTPEFVDICRRDFKSDNFVNCDPFPPTGFKDGQFNFITGYSVFSHLSEKACKAWMTEFSRILAPGGIVAVTTRGRPFFDFCEAQRANLPKRNFVKKLFSKPPVPQNYLEALGLMFDDFDAARRRYDAGGIVHASEGVGGGGALNTSFYGETFIPEAYAKTAFDQGLTLENFMYDQSYQSHPIMFFRKN